MGKKKNQLPQKYKPNLKRVSDICSLKFPFEGTSAERFFHKWLESKNISVEDYMKEASEGGTFVHKQLENFLEGKELESSKYDDYIISGQEAIDNLEIVPEKIEHYVCNEQIQGTVDLIAKINIKKGKWILDWKTYGLAKDILGIENKYKKPTDKLKKATLQLSIYGYLTGIENIAVIELTRDGYYLHQLKRIPNKKIEEYINQYTDDKNS